MRKPGKLFCIGLMAALMLSAGERVYGAQSSVIEKLAVTVKSAYGEPEEILPPEITVGTAGCSLEDVQYRTEYEDWNPGKKVRVEITVGAEEGKYFPASLNRSQCKVSGADFVSAKSLDDGRIQVKADYRPVMVLGDTQKAGWNSGLKKKALWKPVNHAPGYVLTLYGDNKVIKRMTVETNNIDLSGYMTDLDKTYYYEVKAVPVTADEKKYLKEGNFVASTDQEFDWEDYEREVLQNSGDGGSFKGDNYVLPDGSRAVNTWKKVSGQWYYLDGNGNKVRGWLDTGNRWYYMDQNGVMCTGWVTPDGSSWFFMADNGEMQTGWIQPQPACWYYLNPSGYMERSWIYVGEKWYYMGTDGRMRTGWLNDGGTWYYLNYDGSLAVNCTIDGWYIGPDGVASR